MGSAVFKKAFTTILLVNDGVGDMEDTFVQATINILG